MNEYPKEKSKLSGFVGFRRYFENSSDDPGDSQSFPHGS